jgi:hypothetical protein
LPVFAVAVAVPLSVSAAKLARMPSLGRRSPELDEPVDPAAVRLSELIAKDHQRQGRQWSFELKERLDRPLGEQPRDESTKGPPPLQRGVLAPAMLLLVRRWLNIQ